MNDKIAIIHRKILQCETRLVHFQRLRLTSLPCSFWALHNKYLIVYKKKQECIRSKAHCLLRDRIPNTYNFILELPWPQNDLDFDDHIKIISWMWLMNVVSNSQNNQFYKSDLDLDPMTLLLKLDPRYGPDVPPYQK